MRKGSKKPICIVPNPAEITDPIDLEQLSSGKTYKSPYEPLNKIYSIEIDILLRLCDACHEMDTRTEPWASIRKDIERLK